MQTESKEEVDHQNAAVATNDNDEKSEFKVSTKRRKHSISIQAAFNMATSEVASQWICEKTLVIKNPLVVMLGISEYDGLPILSGVPKDYKHMVVIFSKLFGYDMLYKLSTNEYNHNKKDGNKNDSFKLNWTCDDIDDLIKNAKEALEDENRQHDSLIFIISCHGQAEGDILDSECEEYSLYSIFAQFDGVRFPKFAHCPKLFFIDACRGTLQSKAIPVKFHVNDKSQEIVLATKGGGDQNENKSGLLRQKILNIHDEANFFFVYANPDGYAAFDGGDKGGYLIRAIYKVFQKNEIVSKHLDSIVYHIAEKVKKLVGSQSMQHLQTVSNVHYRIRFQPRGVSGI